MILLPMVASAHDIEVQNADGVTIYYNYINDGKELEVTFRGDNYSYYDEYKGNIIIPEEVTYMNRTRKVTSIGYEAFASSYSLTSVIIPNSVTSIGEYAFSDCNSLTSVTIGNSVTSIGDRAFEYCRGLTSVTIPNSVTSIGDYAFVFCDGLTSVTFHCKEIGSWFDGLGIKEIVIGDEVTSIGLGAFSHCSNMTSVTIPNSVTSIGDNAFSDCNSLTSVTIGNSVTSIGLGAFSDCNSLTSVTIPNNVTTIGDWAFSDCSDLTSVTFGNSVTSIGRFAFENCKRLTSIEIPNSVTSIGSSAFKGTGWYNTQPDGMVYVGKVLYEYKGTMPANTSIIIKEGTLGIGGSAFNFCSGLTTVTIPNSVMTIGGGAFNYCSGLMSVTIPNSVTSIGDYAFYGCSGLTSFVIPNSVTSIGNFAVNSCKGLTSVTIGNSVTSIGIHAFNSDNITTVVSLIANPFIISGVFSLNTLMKGTLYVPTGTKETYKATGGWKDFLFIEEGAGGGDTPTTQKCEKPTISYENGKLTFSSATEGAVCQYSITDTDIKAGSGNEVQLTVTYNISVYATKAGYENSEAASATLCWIDQTPATEGITDGIANVPARTLLIKNNGGQLTIEGADDGEAISVYTVNGMQSGSAISQNGAASINTNLQAGSIAIVKIGNKSVKVIIR